MMHKIIFKGNIPSKKNSKRIGVNRYTHKPFITSSDKFKIWYEEQEWLLKGKLPKLIVDKIIDVTFTYFPKTAGKADLSNKFESIMDFLVDKNVIADDNYFVVRKCILEFGGVDKLDPRGEVVINY